MPTAVRTVVATAAAFAVAAAVAAVAAAAAAVALAEIAVLQAQTAGRICGVPSVRHPLLHC